MGKTPSGYSKKRKFGGNPYTTVKEKQAKLAIPSTCATPSSIAVVSDDGNETATPTQKRSVSARKIGTPEVQQVDKAGEVAAKGFHLIDLAILSTIFALLPCKKCKKFALELVENMSKHKGCASSLQLHCNSCHWKEEFYTSAKVNYFFEVNRRFVYAMRSIGSGASAAERFCGLMNMPPIPRSSPYAAHNKALSKAAKEVCSETMNDAAKEIHILKGKAENEMADCGISCDGSWQRRGFSSLSGRVTAISMDTGKVLDAEVLSRFCKECKKHEEDTPENLAWQADHKTKCKANFQGSAPAMEPAGALKIFERSVESNKLRYTEFFGDGDSESYGVVKEVYNSGSNAVSVAKKECVGHVQKRIGTALRKFRKDNKGMGVKANLLTP